MLINENAGGDETTGLKKVHASELPDCKAECSTAGGSLATQIAVTTPERPLIVTLHAMVPRAAENGGGYVCLWCAKLEIQGIEGVDRWPVDVFQIGPKTIEEKGKKGVAMVILFKRPKTRFIVPCSIVPRTLPFSKDSLLKFLEATK